MALFFSCLSSEISRAFACLTVTQHAYTPSYDLLFFFARFKSRVLSVIAFARLSGAFFESLAILFLYPT